MANVTVDGEANVKLCD